MKNKYFLLILPITILIFGAMSVFYFVAKTSASLSIYFALLCIVAIFTAKQSIFTQTSLIWDIKDLNSEEVNQLAFSITKDFSYFLLFYSVTATVLFLSMKWLLSAV